MTAGVEPGFQLGALLGSRVGAGDVRDQQAAQGQPFLQVGEVVGDGSRNWLFGQQREEPKPGIVVVVPGTGAGRKAADDDMSALVDDVDHVLPFIRCQGYRGPRLSGPRLSGPRLSGPRLSGAKAIEDRAPRGARAPRTTAASAPGSFNYRNP